MDVQMIIDLLILAWLTWVLISLKKTRKTQDGLKEIIKEEIDINEKRIQSNKEHMQAMEDFKKFSGRTTKC